MPDGSERRRHKRIGYDMPVDFIRSVLEFGNMQRREFTGRGIDISDEGIGFMTDSRLEPGEYIQIKRPDNTYTTAEVRWVGEMDGKFRVGVLMYKD